MSSHLIKLCRANLFAGLSSLALSDDVLYKMLKGTFRSAFLDLADGGFRRVSKLWPVWCLSQRQVCIWG